VVPETAVQRGPDGPYAYVLGNGNKVDVRKLTVADEGNGQSVITNGLTPGEKVVTDGQYRLTPGALVQATSAETQDGLAQNQSAGAK
jgi:membrane fusion protein, multidrug efflux system